MVAPRQITAADIAPLAVPSVLNANPTALLKWRLARAKVRSGTSRAKVLHVGESTSMGYGAGTGSPATVNARRNAAGSRMAVLMAAAGLPAHCDGYFGYTLGGGGTDSRFTLGTGWAVGGANSIGGPTLSTTGTNTLSFTPIGAVDTFDVWYAGAAGSATLSINVDGGAATTVNTGAGSNIFAKVTISAGSVGAHTVNIAKTTGGSAFIAGIDAYDSTTTKVSHVIAGYAGGKATDISNAGATSAPWYPITAIPAYAPDLTIINEGINDAAAGTSAAAFAGFMQPLITAAKATGDVILVVPNPVALSGASATIPQANQDVISGAIYALATANNCPLIDLRQQFIDWATANTSGFMSDGYHPKDVGYWDIAQKMLQAASL